jgi:DNA-binding NarL/FixJ family response regulator
LLNSGERNGVWTAECITLFLSDTKQDIDTKLPHNQETSEQNGSVKYKAIQMLKSGVSTEKVAASTGLKKSTVMAYKAHLTMGTYKVEPPTD